MDQSIKTAAGRKRGTSDVDVFLGERLRAFRLQAGWSQSELAGRLDVSFQQVQKYEKGTNRLSAASLHEIARLFGLPLAAFFEEDVERAAPTIGESPRLAVGNRAEARLIAAFRKSPQRIRPRFLALIEASASLEDSSSSFDD